MELIRKGWCQISSGWRIIADRVVESLPGYEQMVTSRISLEDLVKLGFEELINNKDDHIKILISPKLEPAC
jgi:hypothetical protein